LATGRESGASPFLRRATALAGLGLELWGRAGEEGWGECWEGLGGYGGGIGEERLTKCRTFHPRLVVVAPKYHSQHSDL